MSGDGPTTTAVHDPRRTVGVEEELLLVDAQTGEPRSLAASALAAAESDPAVARASEDHGGELEGELQQQQLETGTRPCRDVSELITELRRWRSLADRAAQQVGARAVALATSPIAVPPSVTPNPRYRRMVAEFGLTAAEQLACGCHVHVAVESEAEGVAVLDRIRVWLPVLLACSANSPFWQGEETGYASFRSQAWGRWPVAGPTDAFGSAEAYHSLVQRLLDSRTVLDHGMLYFDARLSAQYPTVEVRVADVCLEVADAALIACLTRALVETAAGSWRAGEPAPAMPTSVLRMAMWRAGRSGLRAELLDPLTGRPEPAGDVVGRLVGHVRAVLAPDELIMVERRVEALLRDGSGADRQLARWRSDHDLAAVVADAAEITHR